MPFLWCRAAASAQTRLEADDSSVSLASSRSGLGRPAGLFHTALKHKAAAGAGPGAFCSTPPSASKKGSWSMTNTGRASPGPTPKPKVHPSQHVLYDCVPYPTNLPFLLMHMGCAEMQTAPLLWDFVWRIHQQAMTCCSEINLDRKPLPPALIPPPPGAPHRERACFSPSLSPCLP